MWYKILKVNKDASREEIENAYQKLSTDPKISTNMNKSYKIREAYKEGLSQLNNPSNNSNIKLESNKSTSNKALESALDVSDGVFSAYRIIKLFILCGIFLFFIGMLIFDALDSAFVDEFDYEEETIYSSDTINCIANKYSNDATSQTLKEELLAINYQIEIEEEDFLSFYKTIDNSVVVIEATTTEYGLECTMKVINTIKTSWNYKDVTLVQTANINIDSIEGDSYEIAYYIYDSRLTNRVETVATSRIDEDDSLEDAYVFIESDFRDSKIAEYATTDNNLKLINILDTERKLLLSSQKK